MRLQISFCALIIGSASVATSALAQGGGCVEPPSIPARRQRQGQGRQGRRQDRRQRCDPRRRRRGGRDRRHGFVPDGVYMIDAVNKAIKLKSDMTLQAAPGAVLKAIPNKARNYSILDIAGASNVTVTGGTLEGERGEHKAKAAKAAWASASSAAPSASPSAASPPRRCGATAST